MAHHAILFVTMRDHGCLVLVQKATVFTMATVLKTVAVKMGTAAIVAVRATEQPTRSHQQIVVPDSRRSRKTAWGCRQFEATACFCPFPRVVWGVIVGRYVSDCADIGRCLGIAAQTRLLR